MDQSLLKYAIRVDERAFFIRFYVWLWEADTSKINFCKLWWGYIFAAPALPLRLLLGWIRIAIKGFSHIFGAIRWAWRHRPRLPKPPKTVAPAKPKRSKPKVNPKPVTAPMQKAIGGIEHAGTLAAMRARPVFDQSKRGAEIVKKRVRYVTTQTATTFGEVVSIPWVGKVLLGLAGGLGLAILGFGMYYAAAPVAHAAVVAGAGTKDFAVAVVRSEYSLLTILGIVALVVLIVIVWAIAAIGIPYLIYKYFLAPIGTGAAELGGKGFNASFRVIEGGVNGFADAMRIGYYAVKTSTCPRIELEKRPDHDKIKRLEREVDL